jgi:pimeloyl-ACP methyl ester carboxylesterase
MPRSNPLAVMGEHRWSEDAAAGPLQRGRGLLPWAVPVAVAGLAVAALVRADRSPVRKKDHQDGHRVGADARSSPTPRRSPPVGGNARLVFDRVGQGEPLVLLHGHGLSRRSWDPVIARLAAERDVIAVDLPGHGDSPRQPRGRGWAPADQALAVAQLLDQLGLDQVHVAGNSIGGWVALELGRLGRARTITALSPGGLWGRSAPITVRTTMRQARLNARIIRRLAPGAPRTRLAKALFMAQATGQPFHVPRALARRSVHDMAAAPGFRKALRAAERRRFRDGAAIDVPVTVAFGSRDRVLPPVIARRRRQLPAQTRWIRLPGVGHIPMFDDPEAVATLLLDTSRPSVAASAA